MGIRLLRAKELQAGDMLLGIGIIQQVVVVPSMVSITIEGIDGHLDPDELLFVEDLTSS